MRGEKLLRKRGRYQVGKLLCLPQASWQHSSGEKDQVVASTEGFKARLISVPQGTDPIHEQGGCLQSIDERLHGNQIGFQSTQSCAETHRPLKMGQETVGSPLVFHIVLPMASWSEESEAAQIVWTDREIRSDHEPALESVQVLGKTCTFEGGDIPDHLRAVEEAARVSQREKSARVVGDVVLQVLIDTNWIHADTRRLQPSTRVVEESELRGDALNVGGKIRDGCRGRLRVPDTFVGLPDQLPRLDLARFLTRYLSNAETDEWSSATSSLWWWVPVLSNSASSWLFAVSRLTP